VIPVFDGHNDALTRTDHALFVDGRPDGDLDLPRMAAGGLRGGMFAMFAPSPGDHEFSTHPEPVEHEAAAAICTAAAGRLMALAGAGHLRLVTDVAELDAAAAGGPPGAVLHIEGAEAIDPDLDALELWYAAGLRSLGPVWSRPNAFGHGVPFLSPSSPDTGPGLSVDGMRLVRRCAALGVLGPGAAGARADRRHPLRRARPVCDVAQPDRRPTR
jgi:membrane dipeptidase